MGITYWSSPQDTAKCRKEAKMTAITGKGREWRHWFQKKSVYLY